MSAMCELNPGKVWAAQTEKKQIQCKYTFNVEAHKCKKSTAVTIIYSVVIPTMESFIKGMHDAIEM
jgi:hypothetical protein